MCLKFEDRSFSRYCLKETHLKSIKHGWSLLDFNITKP